MLNDLRQDLLQARKHNVGTDWFSSHIKILIHPGTMAVIVYRFSHWVRKTNFRAAAWVVAPFAFAARCFVEAFTGVHISPAADIGAGFVVHTCQGVFIPPTRIGRNCVVNHGVLIAQGVRHIGDNVYFSAGAKIVSKVRIGNNVMLAPNSLIVGNVPDNVTMLGNPAHIIWSGDARGATRLQKKSKPRQVFGQQGYV